MKEGDIVNTSFGPMPVIFAYTRKQAIEDGVLVDLNKVAADLKDDALIPFKYPLACTAEVFNRYIAVPEVDGKPFECQDIKGRLWDICWMLLCAMKRSNGGSLLTYKLLVAMPDRGDWISNERPPERGSGLTRTTHRLVTLKAVCGPGDEGEPVLTIMLPGQD